MSTDRHKDVTVVILVGGRGTRIQAIHPDTAKPMVKVRGRPFLSWLTSWLASQGLTHFIFSTGYHAEQIEQWSGNDEFPGTVRICRREAEPLGTGGGLFNCLDGCREWVLVANGDSICMGSVEELLRLRRTTDLAGALVGVPVKDASRYGSLSIDADGHLLALHEKVPGMSLINSGLYLFKNDLLRQFRRPGALSIEQDLIPEMIKTGTKLCVVRLQESAFIDIGTPEGLGLVDDFIESHLERHLPLSC